MRSRNRVNLLNLLLPLGSPLSKLIYIVFASFFSCYAIAWYIIGIRDGRSVTPVVTLFEILRERSSNFLAILSRLFILSISILVVMLYNGTLHLGVR